MLHTHSEQPTLRSKTYITDKNRCFVTKANSKQQIIHSPIKTTNEWNPLKDSHDTSSDEEYHVTIPVRTKRSNIVESSSSTTSPSDPTTTPQQQTSSHNSSNNSPAQARPTIYQHLDIWMENQRRQAAQQLAVANEMENSDLDEHNILENNDRRALIKENAKKKIKATFQRLPQLDGAATDSSAPSSTNASPDTSITLNRSESTSPISTSPAAPISPSTASTYGQNMVFTGTTPTWMN